jgi:hypothetical protein
MNVLTDPSAIGYPALFGGVLLGSLTAVLVVGVVVSVLPAWRRRRKAAREPAGPGPGTPS